MAGISFEVVEREGIERCRGLCNELMAFQKSKATIEPWRFEAMNFDTRLKKSYDGALEKHLVMVLDDDVPVGYVFSTVESREAMMGPPFHLLSGQSDLPPRIGCLSNLYLKDGYRGGGLGTRLFKMGMDWLEGFPDVVRTYVFISNGNDRACRFYLRHGFTYSHEVMGGFIKALCRRKAETPADRTE